MNRPDDLRRPNPVPRASRGPALRRAGTLLLLLLAGGGSAVLAQGLTWESIIVRKGGGGDTARSSSYYMPKMFRESGTGRGESIIIRLDRKVFIVVDDVKKQYSEMTFDEMERAMGKMRQGMEAMKEEMERQIAGMPADQQQMMRDMMAARMPGMKASGPVEVTKTAETRTIAGYSCAQHQVRRGGEEFMTLWTTTGVKGAAAFGEEMKEFAKRMSAMNPSGDNSESEAMMKVQGFPMQTTVGGVTTTVTSVTPGSIPAATFDVPAGYKKVRSPLMEEAGDKR